MTEEQVALYGGALWLGPVVLAAYLLLYWWLDNGPITRDGKRRAEGRSARSAADRRRRWPPREDGNREDQPPRDGTAA
jgi:hypothetical protein